jgi:hypothetical protein
LKGGGLRRARKEGGGRRRVARPGEVRRQVGPFFRLWPFESRPSFVCYEDELPIQYLESSSCLCELLASSFSSVDNEARMLLRFRYPLLAFEALLTALELL